MGRIPSAEIDLGLALLSLLRKPGVRLSSSDIAAWCGCSRHYIEQEERRAIMKIRKRMQMLAIPHELSETAPANFPKWWHVARRMKREARPAGQARAAA